MHTKISRDHQRMYTKILMQVLVETKIIKWSNFWKRLEIVLEIVGLGHVESPRVLKIYLFIILIRLVLPINVLPCLFLLS